MNDKDYESYLNKSDFSHIIEAKEFSQECLKEIRDALDKLIMSGYSDYKDLFTVVTTGSYARMEASKQSDLDFFIVFNDLKLLENCAVPQDSLELSVRVENINNDFFKNIEKILGEFVNKDVGSTNTFGTTEVQSLTQILKLNYSDERNAELTRRILILLEGTYLYNKNVFELCRNKILERYLTGCDYKFLLNDISRYYRTILTDFHHKIHQKEKDWGVRSIKLKFSRKLIYLSILLVILSKSTQNLSNEERINHILQLLEKEPLNRIYELASGGTNDLFTIMSTYNYFLGEMKEDCKRKKLDGLKREDREQDNTYKELNEQARQFKKSSFSILENCIDKENFGLLIL